MSKKLSFSERCSISYPPEVHDLPQVGYPKVVQKIENGKVVNSVEFVVDDGSELGQFDFNDFALENLLAAGVDLKELRFKEISLRSVDDFVNNLSNVNLKND